MSYKSCSEQRIHAYNFLRVKYLRSCRKNPALGYILIAVIEDFVHDDAWPMAQQNGKNRVNNKAALLEINYNYIENNKSK